MPINFSSGGYGPTGVGTGGVGSAAAPPNFWGAGAVLRRKFGDVTD